MYPPTLSSSRPISRSSTNIGLPCRSTLGHHPGVHVDPQPFLAHHPHLNNTLPRHCACIHVTSQAQHPRFNVTSSPQRPHVHFNNTIKLTVVVTVKRKYPSPQERALDQLDSILDLSGQKVDLQLVSSSQVDSSKLSKTITIVTALIYVQCNHPCSKKVLICCFMKPSQNNGHL